MTFAQYAFARVRPLWKRIITHDVSVSAELTELSKVRSVTSVSDEYSAVPIGAVGTIVHVYEKGKAFEVEFHSPKHAVLFTKCDQIEAE